MGERTVVFLACAGCGARNYRTTRRVRDGKAAIEKRKFCKTCGTHTVHKETK